MQFIIMPRIYVRQFTLVHVAKCHSTISWIMSSYFPMNWFQRNSMCIDIRQLIRLCPYHMGVKKIIHVYWMQNKVLHEDIFIYVYQSQSKLADYNILITLSSAQLTCYVQLNADTWKHWVVMVCRPLPEPMQMIVVQHDSQQQEDLDLSSTHWFKHKTHNSAEIRIELI